MMEIIRYISRWEIEQFLNHNITLADFIRTSRFTDDWCSPDDAMIPIKIIIPDNNEQHKKLHNKKNIDKYVLKS